jgi:hypothetical protein
LLVLLANPLGADVMLDEHHVQAAMWGNPGFVIPIDMSTGGRLEGREAYLRLENYGVFASPEVKRQGGRLGEPPPHVSAVVVVHERPRSMDWREQVMHRHPPAAWEQQTQQR